MTLREILAQIREITAEAYSLDDILTSEERESLVQEAAELLVTVENMRDNPSAE